MAEIKRPPLNNVVISARVEDPKWRNKDPTDPEKNKETQKTKTD